MIVCSVRLWRNFWRKKSLLMSDIWHFWPQQKLQNTKVSFTAYNIYKTNTNKPLLHRCFTLLLKSKKVIFRRFFSSAQSFFSAPSKVTFKDLCEVKSQIEEKTDGETNLLRILAPFLSNAQQLDQLGLILINQNK